MTELEPIHVRVARALGWSHLQPGGILLPGAWVGYPPRCQVVGEKEQVPWFERDWAATGPLIEKLGIMVHGDTKEAASKRMTHDWDDDEGNLHTGPFWFSGATTLEAVCAVIVAMGKAGLIR